MSSGQHFFGCPPIGFEYTGEVRFPKEGEYYSALDGSQAYAHMPIAVLCVETYPKRKGPRKILRKLEGSNTP